MGLGFLVLLVLGCFFLVGCLLAFVFWGFLRGFLVGGCCFYRRWVVAVVFFFCKCGRIWLGEKKSATAAVNIVKQMIVSFQAVMLDCRSRKHISTLTIHPINLRKDI